LGNRLVETRAGAWVLPFWREPAESWRDSHAAAHHLLQDAPPPPPAPAPPGAAADGGHASAGVLISRDRGRSWRACGRVSCAETWLLGGAVAELPAREGKPMESRLLMLLRSGVGTAYQAISRNGGETWQPAAPASLPNPNDKMSVCGLPGGQLVAAYSHSATRRSPLCLAVSTDPEVQEWAAPAVVVEPDRPEPLHFASPTVLAAGPTPDGSGRQRVLVGYSVWTQGLCLATCDLETAEKTTNEPS
jgi:hypothetical protein